MTNHTTDKINRPVRRRGERGQMVPLIALFAVVLLGCTAIATDLSVSTHYQRNLQNATDAAAIAGAKQLPVSVSASKQVTATKTALALLHNTFPWTEGAGTTPSALAASGCNSGALQCSVSLCAGLTVAGCTTVPQGSNQPFSLTVNTPPKTALNATFNSSNLSTDPNYYQRVEVVMHQQSGGFFSGIFGVSSEVAGAQSVAWHFASGQPFPFALFSRTVIQDGNSPEIIAGNIYAQRYLAPQSSGQAAICAGPDPNGNPGYIVLGAPQAPDAGYAGDGQNGNPKVKPGADPLVDGFSPCSSIGAGQVGMSGTPVNTAGCAAAFGGEVSGSQISFDSTDQACEANPALTVPNVAALPIIPAYTTTQCQQNPSGTISPWASGGTPPNANAVAFYCPGNKQPGLNITAGISLVPGIYEILPGGGTPCDVMIDGSGPALTGVTFYLINGAGICTSEPSGVTITQTPYCGTCSNPDGATPGDGVYDVISDNSGNNPTVSMQGSGGGSTSGIWQMTGVIWLPTGTVNIANKNALEDTGQILVNTWNDQSGNHNNPSVTYNGPNAPAQQEELKLVE